MSIVGDASDYEVKVRSDGNKYDEERSIFDIMMACLQPRGCNNATGRSAHGLALLSLLRARFEGLVCPANTTRRT